MADGGRFDLGAPHVVQAIKDLADSDALTLVVGAGASMEAGLPGWTSLLERLLLPVTALTDSSAPASGGVSVRHLHGLMTSKAAAGEVVLSEAHYHRMQDGEHWQEHFMAERLSESSCLFIGTSLTDPNLLRYLYRQNDMGRPHVACFARQQDVDFYNRATRAAAEATERISDLRWAEAGTRAMRMDHYWEIAQFVWEVQLARQAGQGYRPFPERAAQWESSLDKALLTTGRMFDEIQDEMQMMLQDIVDWLRDRLIEAACSPARGERLGCSLWVYRPSTGSLTNWFSSDRAWRDVRTLAPVKADWRASLTASRAFCEGQIVWDETTTQVATRWNYVVGVPLYLEDRVTGRLPVGAMTLASTAPRRSSALARGLDKVVRLKVAETLQQRFGHLLDAENG